MFPPSAVYAICVSTVNSLDIKNLCQNTMTVWKTVRDDSCLISYTESYSSGFQSLLYHTDTPMLICLMSEILFCPNIIFHRVFKCYFLSFQD